MISISFADGNLSCVGVVTLIIVDHAVIFARRDCLMDG